MSSHLGVLVKYHGSWSIHYARWGAQQIGLDIALNGMERTVERVNDMTREKASDPRDWPEADWMDGMLLIDHTRKLVVWSEEDQGSYFPRLANALIERTWEGWTAIWSSAGCYGVLRAAGVTPESGIATANPSSRNLQDSAWFGPWDDFRLGGAFSVILDDGRTVMWSGDGSLDVVAGLGPASMHQLAVNVLHCSQ